MAQRRSWADINLRQKIIYWKVHNGLCMMGKDALFKTVEDTLIPGNLPIVIIESKGTDKTIPCDYI